MLCLLGCSCLSKVVTSLAIVLITIKLYLKLTTGWCKSNATLEGKTVIVTGANTGIGYETAADLLRRGAKVIIACRSKERAEDARKRLIIDTAKSNVVVKLVDFAKLSSVRAFAKDINETEERLDILVNNAGGGGFGTRLTEDGLQLGMQINYFAPFLLTNLLLKLLIKSGASRIVNVASFVAKFVDDLDVDKLNDFPGDTRLYARSKLCNILFTMELAKKLRETKVITNSLHPGCVETEIFRKMPSFMKLVFMFFVRLFFKTPEAGAQTSIYLAVDEKLSHVSGEHFEDCQRVEPYKVAQDSELAKKLWLKSEKLVQLKAGEKPF